MGLPRKTASVALTAIALALVGLHCGGDGRSPTSPPTPSPCAPPPRPSIVVPRPTGSIACRTSEELAVVDAEVAIAFEGDASIGSLACRASDGSRDLTQVQKNVYVTLLFMKGLGFDAPLPWTSQSLYDWFRLEVRGVRIRTDIAYDSCCDPPGVLSLRGDRVEESTVPSYLEIMVHEARHVHGGPHTCGQSQDNTIADLGAFGGQYQLLMWLANHWPEANQLEHEYALNRAAWLRATAFCGECQ